MKEQNWKRKEYESWDEAFRGLTPLLRQQSVRVAAYTQALFVQACSLRFAVNTKDGEERMRGQYADLAYKCGMYHQLGKALVPPEYQLLQKDFTEEERAVYEKYTTDGRLLVANLQEKNVRAREKRRGELIELPTRNVPFLMVRETCEQHMERFDGSGYPAGKKGSEISPIAQIVGLAKELDRLASEIKSETPFDIAYETLIAQSGSAWSPALIEVLKAARENCRTIYNKYIAYTRTIPKTIPLIDKRPDRVMGLSYRPMVCDAAMNRSDSVRMYEAIPWFGGVANQPDETESAQDLRELFKKTDLVEEISWYLLYEATDALLRVETCKLELEAIVLDMLPDFYLMGTQLQKFNLLFEHQPVDKSKLLLTIPESVVRTCSKTNLEIIRRYLRNGIKLVLDDYHPDEDLTPAMLLDMGFTHLRLGSDQYLNQESAGVIAKLQEQGFVVLGGGADTPEILNWLVACGVRCSAGTVTGAMVDEDNLILDSLAREQL